MSLLLLILACTSPSDTGDTGDTGTEEVVDLSIQEIGTEAEDGTPLYKGELVRTAGIATVSMGVLGGRKLRIHVQQGEHGVAVDADEVVAAELATALGSIVTEGDELELVGLVTDEGLPSQDGEGEVDGLIRLRITDSADVVRLSQGNALPEPRVLTVAQLEASGDDWEGALVTVLDLVKATEDAETWVTPLDSSTTVDTYESGGDGPLKVRLGKGENTGGYGDDPGTAAFGVTGPLREDTTVTPASDPEGMRFEIWPRRAEDILR